MTGELSYLQCPFISGRSHLFVCVMCLYSIVSVATRLCCVMRRCQGCRPCSLRACSWWLGGALRLQRNQAGLASGECKQQMLPTGWCPTLHERPGHLLHDQDMRHLQSRMAVGWPDLYQMAKKQLALAGQSDYEHIYPRPNGI